MSKNIILKLTVYGILFGLSFPVITLIVDLMDKDMTVSFANMFKLHNSDSLYYVVDLAPIILGAIGFFVAKYIRNMKIEEEISITTEKIKSKKYGEYIELLINGNYDFEIELGDLQEDDELEDSLETLRNNLINNEERERMQNWSTEGLAKFIEVLRSDTGSLTELGDRIISNLVNYVEANQGVIFVKEGETDEDTELQLLCAYAYEKKKFLNKSIKPGVGLIGTAFTEKNTIFLKEIPEDYINISSGLGQSKPKSILIVPLIVNDNVYGVIELASFKEFKEFEIEFVEKLAENIASTVSGIKTAEITKRLLEESQLQTEQMRSQEEEMRQNMEELTATQEEMERKEGEYHKKIEGLEQKVKTLESTSFKKS